MIARSQADADQVALGGWGILWDFAWVRKGRGSESGESPGPESEESGDPENWGMIWPYEPITWGILLDLDRRRRRGDSDLHR